MTVTTEAAMSNNDVVPFYAAETAAILEGLLTQDDLARLGPQERAEYYLRVCQIVEDIRFNCAHGNDWT